MSTNGWPMVKLGDVLTQYKEYIETPEPREYPKLSVKLYGRGVVLDSPADGSSLKMQRHQVAKSGQVILSEIWGKKGAIGFVPKEGDGALCTSHFFLFDVREDRVERGWLQVLFSANYLAEQLNARAFGTTGYAAVRPNHLLSADIPSPPRGDQRRIIGTIDRVATKIDQAKDLRLRAVEERRALRNSFLRTMSERFSQFSELGDVLLSKPRNGWSAKCDNAADGAAVLTLAAVTGYFYDPLAFKRTSLPTDPDAHYWLRPGDLLVTRSNTPQLVGHAAVYNGHPHPCIYPDLMMRLELDHSRVDRSFVWCWLQTPLVREFIERSAKGTSPSMKKISQSVVMSIPFPAQVSLQEQQRVAADLDSLQSKIAEIQRMQEQVSAQIDALLPSVLNLAITGGL